MLERDLTGWIPTALATLVFAGLLLRRRTPYLALALCLPALVTSEADIPPLIILYAVARYTQHRRMLIGCAAVVVIGFVLKLPIDFSQQPQDVLLNLLYGVPMGAAPSALGQLVQTRAELSQRLVEIGAARQHEQRLVAQKVLARERAQLAREMHDVVSHQVSLIAVQAGALQVSTPDNDVRDSASVIRQLSVNTLDELRHMVAVLRTSDSPRADIAPQPSLAQLDELVANCGIDTQLDGQLPPALDNPIQRTIYRTIQEALTNIRKHAPGANALIKIRNDITGLRVTVINTPPTRPALALPSAQHGLTGLGERAELLGGALHAAPTPDGGFELELRLPPQEHPTRSW